VAVILALNAYKPEKDSVDDDEIYENVRLSITEIETKDRKTICGRMFSSFSCFLQI